jgi:hypothetical protein
MPRLALVVLAPVATCSLALAQGRPTRFWNLTRNTISELYLAPAGTTLFGPNHEHRDRRAGHVLVCCDRFGRQPPPQGLTGTCPKHGRVQGHDEKGKSHVSRSHRQAAVVDSGHKIAGISSGGSAREDHVSSKRENLPFGEARDLGRKVPLHHKEECGFDALKKGLGRSSAGFSPPGLRRH